MNGEEKRDGYEGSSNVKYRDRSHEASEARIGAQLAFMQQQIQETHSSLSELINRIDQILIPEMDENSISKEIDVPRNRASELSNTIDDLNSQFSRIQRRIGATIERVQL